MVPRSLLLAAVLAACAGRPAPAGPPPTAQVGEVGDRGASAFASPFFPADYEASIFADYTALRECGLLDQLERMPMLSSYLEAVAAFYGCRSEDVLRVRTAITSRQPRDRQPIMVSVAETVPVAGELRAPGKGWEPTRIGDHSGFAEGKGPTYPAACFRADPVTAVHGDHECLAAVVTGARPSGGPRPELLGLLGGERVLFQYVSGRFGGNIDPFLDKYGFMLPGDPDDPEDFLRLRLQLDARGNVEVSLLLRYAHGAAGLRRCEEGVRKGLDELLARPDLKQFQPLLGAISTMHRDRDLVIRLQLGQPRDAVRTAERAVLAVMAMQNGRNR